MLANNRKATLQAIHSDAVNKAVKDQKNNIVLDGLPHPINDLIMKERATLAQLRSGYCKLLGSYKSRIKKDASLAVCANCGKTPHDVNHLFAFPAHPTALIPSVLWRKPVESIREFGYLEEGNLDWDEPRPKANNNNNRFHFRFALSAGRGVFRSRELWGKNALKWILRLTVRDVVVVVEGLMWK